MRSGFFGDIGCRIVRAGGIGRARVDRSVGDPLFEVSDLLVRQFAVGWHLKAGIVVLDGFDQEAFAGFTGKDGRPKRSTSGCSGGRVQSQFATEFTGLGLCAVAFVASLYQDRTDFGLEEIEFGILGSARSECPSDQQAGLHKQASLP
jgi:hypothetical protein